MTSRYRLRYYFDENTPRAILVGLRRRGVDVVDVQEDGLAGKSDPVVMARAAELGRVLVSQDRDMLRHARSFQRDKRYFAGLVYASQKKVTIGLCVRELERIAAEGTADELEGNVVYLSLRR